MAAGAPGVTEQAPSSVIGFAGSGGSLSRNRISPSKAASVRSTSARRASGPETRSLTIQRPTRRKAELLASFRRGAGKIGADRHLGTPACGGDATPQSAETGAGLEAHHMFADD